MSKGKGSLITNESALANMIQLISGANIDSDQEMCEGEARKGGK